MGAFYPSQIGGPCNTIYWHTSALHNQGFDPTVITTSRGINEGEVLLNEMHELKCGTVYYGANAEFTRKEVTQLITEIKAADIIHLNGLFSKISMFTFFYTMLFFSNKKIIWSVRGELNTSALAISSWKKKILLFFYQLSSRKVLFHATSGVETNEISTNFPDAEVVTLPNFIEPHAKLDIPYKKSFLFVGRIHPIKSLHKLIDGFAQSRFFRVSEFSLVLVGKHEDRHQYYDAELKKKINELNLEHKIIWKGHLTGLEKEKAYASAYALCLLSETENFGNVVVEALNQGTPVIASTGTPWAILEEYACGWHIDNNPSTIASTIDFIIKMDQNKYEAMRKNAQTLIKEEFDVNHQITKWTKTYENAYKK